MAIIIPAAVLVAPAVCHMMRANQEEETKTASQPDAKNRSEQEEEE